MVYYYSYMPLLITDLFITFFFTCHLVVLPASRHLSPSQGHLCKNKKVHVSLSQHLGTGLTFKDTAFESRQRKENSQVKVITETLAGKEAGQNQLCFLQRLLGYPEKGQTVPGMWVRTPAWPITSWVT